MVHSGTVRESHLGFGDYSFFLFLMIYLFCLFALWSCFNTCMKQDTTVSKSYVNLPW